MTNYPKMNPEASILNIFKIDNNCCNDVVDNDEYINEYKKLTKIIHKNKGNIIMQLAEII